MKVFEDAAPARSILSSVSEVRSAWRGLPQDERRRYSTWVAWIAVATLAFVRPLYELVLHASQQSLHSHVVLIPAVSAYLLLIKRGTLPAPGRRSIAGALVTGAAGLCAVIAGLMLDARLSHNDRLAAMTVGYVASVATGGFLFLGSRWMSAAAFPVAFLLFMVPLPDAAVSWLERVSVVASADVSAWLFSATGTPFVRQGEIIALPTIVLEVARECSGIRSSWVLFITSLVASHMFLKSPWRRFILVAFVIPLGIVRNGFRILVIGLLCVHIGPHMINSVFHYRGGPMFFALSLVPLYLLLVLLRRHDRRA